MILNPEIIRNKLFYFSDVAHFFHHETRSFAEHMAFKSNYEGLIAFRDDISELIMGYQNGKRIGKLKIDEIPNYNGDNVSAFIKEGLAFSSELGKWAEDKGYCDVENTAQALSGLFAKTQYLLTLS
jgi:hypothetical protein